MKFIKKGILTTFQDLGKNGLRHLGVNPSGAMDKLAVSLLNILLQNHENEPVLEIHFPAPEILFEEDCIIIIGGADFMPMLDNQVIVNWKAIHVKVGSSLKFKKRVSGNRAYLAKKSLNENQFLPYLGNSFVRQVPNLSKSVEVRFIKGNEYELLTEKSMQSLESQMFTISQNSNRMGFRMNAEPLEVEQKLELVSSAVDFGTMQLLPNGQVIVLMADHQTSGGYPRIGNIISVDLSILAQCGANDIVSFKAVSVEIAEELLILQEKEIQKLKASIRFFNEK
ncbi:biotin-dependent carboxyltransferase family protein [Emticicia sp. SJ17W-69]|uniref:5-oxoprolinase subunit C family protein n=1 Tax=Emticicia sp. SJ17W-69 TaxID=3421657 RepID=UPI003EBC1AF9